MRQEYQFDICSATKNINLGVYHFDKPPSNSLMKSINEIRRANMRHLVETHCNGTLKEFASRVGVQTAQASHLNTGFRNIGDNIARRIENAFDLPRGWLDLNREDNGLTPQEPTAQETPATSPANQLTRTVDALKEAYLSQSLDDAGLQALQLLLESLRKRPPTGDMITDDTPSAANSLRQLAGKSKPK